jgi:hypothetical protein
MMHAGIQQYAPLKGRMLPPFDPRKPVADYFLLKLRHMIINKVHRVPDTMLRDELFYQYILLIVPEILRHHHLRFHALD